MPIVDLEMPKMGESIMEATILKWLKQPGDSVEVDEAVLEIATDKVDSEVPSISAGRITEILFEVHDVVPIGTVIARIDTDGSGAVASTPVDRAESSPVNTPAPEPTPETTSASTPAASNNSNINDMVYGSTTTSASANTSTSSTIKPTSSGDRFYSPLVLNIARKEGVSMQELESIPGTGKGGRVTKKDIIAYVKSGASGQQASNIDTPAEAASAAATTAQSMANQVTANSNAQNTSSAKTAPSSSASSSSAQGNVEIIEMDRMRKLIADHMVNSVATSPHVTSFTEADVTNMVNWRNKVKNQFQEKYNEKLTFTPLFIQAVVKAIQDYPMINSSVDGDNIIVKKDVNIGMAAALPSGNLIVPVIKHADHKNLVGLAADVNDLATRARENKLRPDDTQGGTFTLTNVGTFGSLMGTPIINQPQVAILAVGTIKKRPMVMETPEGDVIAIRQMMYLSLSYDHRIVDGALGASFLTQVANNLENFDTKQSV